MNRTLRIAVATAALTVLPAFAASAHPSLNPNQVPAGEAVDTDLVVPHGCTVSDSVMPEDDADAIATVEFALQKSEGVTVEPGEVDGWEVSEDDDAWVWTDAGGATTDVITFPITITVDGEAGDELDLAAYQECEDGQSYRWTADSAETPAVLLALTEGEVGTMEMDMGDHAGADDMEGDHSEDEEHSEEGDHSEDDSEEGAHEYHPEEFSGEDLTAQAGATALAGEQADDEFGVGIVIAIVAVVLLLVGGLVAVARGKKAT